MRRAPMDMLASKRRRHGAVGLHGGQRVYRHPIPSRRTTAPESERSEGALNLSPDSRPPQSAADRMRAFRRRRRRHFRCTEVIVGPAEVNGPIAACHRSSDKQHGPPLLVRRLFYIAPPKKDICHAYRGHGALHRRSSEADLLLSRAVRRQPLHEESTSRHSSMPSSMSRRARPPAATCSWSFRRRASRAWQRWRTPMPRSGCAVISPRIADLTFYQPVPGPIDALL